MFKILSKNEVAPNVFELVIEAPKVARKARAGQFVIVMPGEESERIPLTLADWDAEQGTITLVVLEVGRTTGQLARLKAGEDIPNLAGPLGEPLEIDRFGVVALAGGCYGIAALLCVAKALKAAGNRVLVMVEARSHFLHYYYERMQAVADEVIQTTADGSLGRKGHAMDALADRLKAGEKIDRVIAVGCPFMMMLTAEATRPHGLKTLVALNPIMVDGTGMCGACRVSVGGQTKFGCVDGPFFDGHAVDWGELFARKAAYAEEEVEAVERGVHPPAHH